MMGTNATELLVLAIVIAIWLAIFVGLSRSLRSLFAGLGSFSSPEFLRRRTFEPVTTMNFPPPLDRLKTIFRGLLIAEISLSVILIPMSLGYGMMLEDPTQEVASVQATAAEIMGAVVIGGLVLVVILAYLAASIAAWVGLFFYRPWARWLYVGVHTSGLILSIAVGVFDFSYQWGLIHSIETVSFFLAGCNVSLLFFSELSQVFDTSATETPVVAAMVDQT